MSQETETTMSTPIAKHPIERLNRRALLVVSALIVVVFWGAGMVLFRKQQKPAANAASSNPNLMSEEQTQAILERLVNDAGERAKRLEAAAKLPGVGGVPNAPGIGVGSTVAPPAPYQYNADARFSAGYPPVAPGQTTPYMSDDRRISADEALSVYRSQSMGRPATNGDPRGQAYRSPLIAGGFTAGIGARNASAAHASGADGDPAFESDNFHKTMDAAKSATFGGPDGPPFVAPGGSQPASDTTAAHQNAWSAEQRTADHRYQLASQPTAPRGRFELLAGSVIPIYLTHGLTSDLPGSALAIVRRNVYDSLTGSRLLVPIGSRVFGVYDNTTAYGQRRILIAWNRLTLPDGTHLDLEGMPASDLSGASGVADKVNNHLVRVFGSALLLSAISAGAQLSQPQDVTVAGQYSPQQIAAAAVGQELARVSSQLIEREMRVQPTLTIRAGFPLNVQVTADIALPGVEE